MDNKTHGVLTTGEILSLDIRANVTDDEAIRFARAIEAAALAKAAPQSPVAPADERETIADYEEVLADHRRLVRELDVLLNGDGAAKQARLCDLVSQVRANLNTSPPSGFRCSDCGSYNLEVNPNAAPTPPTSTADAVDAARYRYIWSKVQAVSPNAFLLPHIKPIPGSNLMRGSVAGHFNEAIDSAMGKNNEK